MKKAGSGNALKTINQNAEALQGWPTLPSKRHRIELPSFSFPFFAVAVVVVVMCHVFRLFDCLTNDQASMAQWTSLNAYKSSDEKGGRGKKAIQVKLKIK